MVLIYLCFVYAPQCLANRKCLITGASYTYHYSLAHLGSSVALWHPHCGNHHFPLFLQPDSKPCTRRCFPLLCPLLMLSPKLSILPSPDTKPSMSLYQFADISNSTGSIPPFPQKMFSSAQVQLFFQKLKNLSSLFLSLVLFESMISLLRGDQEG